MQAAWLEFLLLSSELAQDHRPPPPRPTSPGNYTHLRPFFKPQRLCESPSDLAPGYFFRGHHFPCFTRSSEQPKASEPSAKGEASCHFYDSREHWGRRAEVFQPHFQELSRVEEDCSGQGAAGGQLSTVHGQQTCGSLPARDWPCRAWAGRLTWAWRQIPWAQSGL